MTAIGFSWVTAGQLHVSSSADLLIQQAVRQEQLERRASCGAYGSGSSSGISARAKAASGTSLGR